MCGHVRVFMHSCAVLLIRAIESCLFGRTCSAWMPALFVHTHNMTSVSRPFPSSFLVPHWTCQPQSTFSHFIRRLLSCLFGAPAVRVFFSRPYSLGKKVPFFYFSMPYDILIAAVARAFQSSRTHYRKLFHFFFVRSAFIKCGPLLLSCSLALLLSFFFFGCIWFA